MNQCVALVEDARFAEQIAWNAVYESTRFGEFDPDAERHALAATDFTREAVAAALVHERSLALDSVVTKVRRVAAPKKVRAKKRKARVQPQRSATTHRPSPNVFVKIRMALEIESQSVSVVEIDQIPDGGAMPRLDSESELIARALANWGYSFSGLHVHRESRRYEGFWRRIR